MLIVGQRTLIRCQLREKSEPAEVPVLDSDFAADMEEILKNRKAWNPPAWE